MDCGSGYNSDVVTAIYSGYQKVVLPKAGFYKFAATGAMGGTVLRLLVPKSNILTIKLVSSDSDKSLHVGVCKHTSTCRICFIDPY